MRYWLLFLLIFLLKVNSITAQFYFLEDTYDQIEVHFLKKKIETEANSSFFNVLKIKNPSERPLAFQTNFSYPAAWTFMGEKNQRISLGPNDSILIPFRAATSIDAKGNIGYAIVASLSDMNGNTFKNEYSFVNVPKIQNIIFTPLNRIEYIEKNKNTAFINLFLANGGNTEEEFHLDFIMGEGIEIEGSSESYYHEEHILTPYTDSMIRIPVFISEKLNAEEQFHRIQIKASTTDTTINTSIWLKKLDNVFYNDIPSSYKMFTVELGIQDLFSQFDPVYVTNIRGNYLTKKYGRVYFKAQSLNAQFYNDPWKYGRYLINYRYKGFRLDLGDVAGPFQQTVFGRGANLNLNYKENTLNLLATKSLFIDRTSLGVIFGRGFKSGSFGAGYSVNDDKSQDIISNLGFVKFGYNTKKFGYVKGLLSTSISNWNIDNPVQHIGYGGEIDYRGTFNNLIIDLQSRFGTRTFSGTYNGRMYSLATLKYFLKNKGYLTGTYSYNLNAPPRYNEGVLLPALSYRTNYAKLFYNKLYDNNLLLTLGPVSEERYSNSFFNQNFPHKFRTRNALLLINGRIKGSKLNENYFSFNAKGGINFVTDYEKEIHEDNIIKNWLSMILGASYRGKYWGTYLSYYHGPTTISQQFAQATKGYFPKDIRLMPYVEYPLVKKHLYFDSRLNFIYDITAQSTRLNMTNDLTAYFYDTWQVIFANTIGNTSTIDNITEEKFSFTSTYFEFRIKKDFVLNQPKYHYHDLEMIFFKDLDGNRVKDDGEPGIQNILVSISKDDENVLKEEYNTTGHFMPTELVSDITGKIKYKNIPNGFYILEYFPIGEIKGAYSSEESFKAIHIGKNTKIYIPFTENNKLFGKVILNRSKLSNLGQIDVSNIKVTAEDSHGRKFSTLTDGNGDFTIYVPSVDKYSVKVNNIFFENFNLEQNDYEVQLNGYKQFEVNFIFNEKKRKINFSSSYEYGSTLDGPGIEIVRRTNLSGTVKDATTLKPIVADIKIIDKEGNEITSAKSSLKTGIFTASFIAGDDYAVEVISDEYWFYSEQLYSQQIVTFKNLKKDILLKNITVGQFIPMKTLNFDAGSYDIPAISFPELERLLKILKLNPSVKIAVHGHADDLEILDSDVDLALERAKLVSKYLIANGYNRVKYVGHANTKPIADNETEDGRRLNRRVEIIVTGK